MALRGRRGARVAVALGALAVLAARPSSGDDGPRIDAVTVRFYSPETGGPSKPLFVTERTLAFEARLEARGEEGSGSERFQPRHVRAALERHISEEILARLPLEREPDDAELSRVAAEMRTASVQRVGGDDVVAEAAAAEGIDVFEVTAFFRRRARAAIYVERAITPFLYPTEEQLREIFRTTPHPYRRKKFEDARALLARWYVDERLRAAEASFLQGARTRVKIITTTKPQLGSPASR